MPAYCVVVLDPELIEPARVEVHFPSDREAVQMALQAQSPCPFQLWSTGGFLGYFEPPVAGARWNG